MMDRHKIFWIENLRALACITVILLHLSGPWLTQLQGVNVKVWSIVAIIHSITRFCVPVFLMITGTLLLNRNYNVFDFYRSKMIRVIRPLLYWSIFYIALFISFDIHSGKLYSIIDVGLFVFNSLIYGAAYHFWYLYLLLSLYLFIPLFANYYVRLNKKQIELILVFWIIILISAQVFEQNMILHYLRLTFGYFGYIVLGNYLYNFEIDKRLNNTLAILSLILGFILTFYPVYITYIQKETVASQWFYYLNANVAFISIGVFLLAKNLNFKLNVITSIAKHSFGIYFIHLFYIMFLNKIALPIQFLSLPVQLFVNTFLVLALSYTSILLLNRVPSIKYYVE